MTEAHQASKNMLMTSMLAGFAGAAIALLLAPRSGQETRDRLKTSAHDMKKQAEEKLDSARDQLDHGKEKATELKDRLEDRLSSAINKPGRRSKRGADQDTTVNETNEARQSPVLTAWNEEI